MRTQPSGMQGGAASIASVRRNMRSVWALAVIVGSLAIVGCGSRSRDYAAAHAAELRSETRVLWERYRGGAVVPPSQLPTTVRALSPKVVRVDGRGVFITTQRIFVNESGVFVRHDHDFRASPTGDPSFRPVAADVFWFRTRG